MLTLKAAPKNSSELDQGISELPCLVQVLESIVQYREPQEFCQYWTPLFPDVPSCHPTIQSMSLSPSKSSQKGAAYSCDVTIIDTEDSRFEVSNVPSEPVFFA